MCWLQKCAARNGNGPKLMFEYRRALELNPSNAAAHIGLATWMISHGRTEEALASARRATELDPRNYVGTEIGWILFMGRRYDEAVRELRTALTVKPDEPFALWFLGFALLRQGIPRMRSPRLRELCL